jgi:hypothetical protein
MTSPGITCAKLIAEIKLVLPVSDYSTVSVVGKFNVNQYYIALIILPQWCRRYTDSDYHFGIFKLLLHDRGNRLE